MGEDFSHTFQHLFPAFHADQQMKMVWHEAIGVGVEKRQQMKPVFV